jgi:predicted nucleotidyltransferase component of viral defense system
VSRHVPPASGQHVGRDIALLDIAQDLLLAHLHEVGVFDVVVFKGGTALRKHHAGSRGRFSTDLDFALRSVDDTRDTVTELVAEAADGYVCGPFTFSSTAHRSRWRIKVEVEPPLDVAPVPPLKLDVGPPCWLEPVVLSFQPQPIQDRYGGALPALPTMRLDEVLAEKIARLTRLSTARDASDLVWAGRTAGLPYDAALVRRLAVLKVWVDVNGLDGHWTPAIGPLPFQPETWLRTGREWDDEQIGLLATPPPRLDQLEADMVHLWSALASLGDSERIWATADEGDRSRVIDAIAALPDVTLTRRQMWAHPA